MSVFHREAGEGGGRGFTIFIHTGVLKQGGVCVRTVFRTNKYRQSHASHINPLLPQERGVLTKK